MRDHTQLSQLIALGRACAVVPELGRSGLATVPVSVVANIQETDLAGHQQDTERYGRLLEQADAGPAALVALLDAPGDRLIVTGEARRHSPRARHDPKERP